MRGSLLYALAAIALVFAAIAGIGLLLKPAPPAWPPRTSEADIARFKAMAESACRCARSNPGKPCWDEFNRVTEPHTAGAGASMCGVDDSYSSFVTPAGKQMDVPTSSSVCGDEEARIVAAIHEKALRGAKTDAERIRAIDKAEVEIRAAIEGFKRGEKTPSLASRRAAADNTGAGCG